MGTRTTSAAAIGTIRKSGLPEEYCLWQPAGAAFSCGNNRQAHGRQYQPDPWRWVAVAVLVKIGSLALTWRALVSPSLSRWRAPRR